MTIEITMAVVIEVVWTMEKITTPVIQIQAGLQCQMAQEDVNNPLGLHLLLCSAPEILVQHQEKEIG